MVSPSLNDFPLSYYRRFVAHSPVTSSVHHNNCLPNFVYVFVYLWSCLLLLGLMKFKELFGSFMGHQSEKRTTGKLYGSNGSGEMKNQE
ncbi:hypothetical protein Hanom_Chr05g00408091 [Helianthus anomalus]